MNDTEVYFYSPLCKKTAQQAHNQALLLQFILTEIFCAKEALDLPEPLEQLHCSSGSFYPYDWSSHTGILNKILEHSTLMAWAFPKHSQKVALFEQHLQQLIVKISAEKKSKKPLISHLLLLEVYGLYRFLMPFLKLCEKNKHLVLFLSLNNEKITEITSFFS